MPNPDVPASGSALPARSDVMTSAQGPSIVGWWVIGAMVLAAAPVAALWTMNRDGRFWAGLAAAALMGGGLAAGPLARHLTPGAVWFAAGYPVAVALGLSIEAIQTDGGLARGALLGWAAAAAIGSLPVVGYRRRSFAWFRGWTVWWSLVSLALLFAYGVGVAFAPLAVSSLFAARWVRAQESAGAQVTARR